MFNFAQTSQAAGNAPAASTSGGFTLGLGSNLNLSSTLTNPAQSLLSSTLKAAPATTSTAASTIPGSLIPTTLSTNTANVTQPQQTTSTTTITFKILEDYINKWMSELDSQERDFLNQATQLNALDKLMIENGDKVTYLN